MSVSIANKIKQLDIEINTISRKGYELLITDRPPTDQERAMYRTIIYNDIPKTPLKEG